MNTEVNRTMMRVSTGMLCVAALGLAASLPANAQARRTRPSTGTTPARATSGMSNSTTMTDDDQYSDPMPVSYPQAAPGTINLYHFHTYRGNRMMEGSVQDMRDKNMQMKEDRAMLRPAGMSMRDAMKATYKDNPLMVDPAPANYPIAAPGSLHLFSYSDYTMNKMMPGSATDVRMDKERMRDQIMMSKGPMHFDRAMMPDPFPINYPFAAPGSLDLYTFSDYTGDKLVPGSATDRRMDRDRMMDQQNMKGSKSTRKPKSK